MLKSIQFCLQHWPTLDLLISLTYKLGDFLTTLRYIDLALLDDPKYEKGLRVQQKIYEECPYLHPDPRFVMMATIQEVFSRVNLLLNLVHHSFKGIL